MMTTKQARDGRRFVVSPAGTLRSAVLTCPPAAIAAARPLPGEPSPVFERAKTQFDILVKTLQYFGCAATLLDPQGDDPYQSAVGDAAASLRDGVVLFRPSLPARRGQVERLEREFMRLEVPIAARIAAPGLLDGTDVVFAAGTAFVGAGRRGNTLGRASFAAIAQARDLRSVEVRMDPRAPSLQAVAGAVASDTVVLAGGMVDPAPFAAAGLRTIVLEPGNELGAGVLVLGERRVLADLRQVEAAKILRKNGIAVHAIDLYEFGKIGIVPASMAVALERT